MGILGPLLSKAPRRGKYQVNGLSGPCLFLSLNDQSLYTINHPNFAIHVTHGGMGCALIMVMKILIIMMTMLGSNLVLADEFVHGYVRPSTGRYINPYRRTNPDSTKYNNYSYNPYAVVQPRQPESQPVYTYQVDPVHVPQINPMTGQME